MDRIPSRRYFSLKWATFLSWGNLAVHTIIGFITTPLVLHTLGPEGFGIWAIILSISGYYGLANLGLGSALGRYVSRDVELGNLPSLQATIDAATLFFAATGCVVIGVVYCLGDEIGMWLRIETIDPKDFAMVLLVASVGVVSDFYRAISNSILAASERFLMSNTLTFVQRVSQGIATVAVVVWSPGIFELALVTSGNTIVFQILAQMAARRAIPGLRTVPQTFDTVRLRELLSYGSGTILISVANLVRLRLGSILIARFASIASVTNYTIATNLITNFSSVISGATSALGVRFSKLDAINAQASLAGVFRSSLFATSFLTFGIGSAILIFGDRFMIIWLGREMNEAFDVLSILTCAYIISLCQGPGWNMLFARSKHHTLARATVIESAANIALGLLLLPRFGAIGFAWSTAFTMSVTRLTIQPWLAARVANIRLREFLEPMAIPAVVGILMTGAAKLLGSTLWLREISVISFALSALCFALAYGMMTLILCRSKTYVPLFLQRALRRMFSLVPGTTKGQQVCP